MSKIIKEKKTKNKLMSMINPVQSRDHEKANHSAYVTAGTVTVRR